jgi:hypothetical protein
LEIRMSNVECRMQLQRSAVVTVAAASTPDRAGRLQHFANKKNAGPECFQGRHVSSLCSKD